MAGSPDNDDWMSTLEGELGGLCRWEDGGNEQEDPARIWWVGFGGGHATNGDSNVADVWIAQSDRAAGHFHVQSGDVGRGRSVGLGPQGVNELTSDRRCLDSEV